MSLYLNKSYVQQEAVHQEPVPSVTVPKYNCLSNKRQSTKNQQCVSHCTSTEVSVQQEAVVYQEPATCVTLYLNRGFRPTKGSSPGTSNMYQCTSTEVFVQQDAVHTEPAAWVTVPQQTFLSNKTNFTNLCLDLPVHERLSKKRQFTKNHLSGLYLPMHERCPTTGGSPRTTKA